MKQITNKLSILTIALICGLSMSACTASERTANDKASAGTEQQQQNSASGNKTTTENKATENKAAENEQAKLVEIYDGRQDSDSSKAIKTDVEVVKEEVLAKANKIKEINKNPCEGEDKFAAGGVAGSFTKPNVKQTAYLYKLCDDGNATSTGVVGGIVIVEAGKVVAHNTLKYYGQMDIISLPDINKNGRSEIGLLQMDGGQGMQNKGLSIYEYSKTGDELATLGGTDVWVVGFNSKQSNEQAFKISVEPSANPVFYRETYLKKNGAQNWSLSKKMEKFSLDPADAPQPTLNSVD